MYKVGIIGFGKMGHKHFETFRKIPDIKVIGAYDTDYSKMQGFNIERFNDCKELIKWCDMIDVCTPTDTHKQYICESITAGKNVFIEKPLCRTLKEANEIIKLVKKHKVKIMVGHIIRYFNQNIAIKKLLDNKSIGKPAVVRVSRNSKFRKASNNWFNSYERSGGVILDLMIHDIDFLLWCFGDVKRVYAKNLINLKLPEMDYALAVIRFKNGVIAHLEASWAYPGGFKNVVEIAGDNGLLFFDSRTPFALRIAHERGDIFKDNPVNEDATLLELMEFVDYVRNNKKPRVTLEDAYRCLEVSLAALKSAEKGVVIEL